MDFPQWVVFYYRMVGVHQTETKNAHELLFLNCIMRTYCDIFNDVKGQKIPYCYSFQVFNYWISSLTVSHTFLVHDLSLIFSFFFLYVINMKGKFLCVVSWNMDHINISKGVKGQLDSEKRIRHYISKQNRNLPSTCPSKPQCTLLCHNPRTLCWVQHSWNLLLFQICAFYLVLFFEWANLAFLKVKFFHLYKNYWLSTVYWNSLILCVCVCF